MSNILTVRGIVVGHGNIPEGLLDAVRRIAGDQSEGLTAISNSGLSVEDLKIKLDAVSGSDPTIMLLTYWSEVAVSQQHTLVATLLNGLLFLGSTYQCS